MAYLVEAKLPDGQYGFDGQRRRNGDQFYIEKPEMLASWMIPVGWEVEKKKRTRKSSPSKPDFTSTEDV